MPIPYERFKYIYPQRPSNSVPPSLLGFYERKGWVAQIKKNGTNSVIFQSPDGKLNPMGRHNNPHKQWEFSSKSRKSFDRVSNGSWNVFNAELLHSKTPHIKDTNYLHDLLVYRGEFLLDVPYYERYKQLVELFEDYVTDETNHYYILNDNTWIAKNQTKGFKALFKSLDNAEDEGLVIKNLKATCQSRLASVKCRKPHKNYSF